MLHCHDVIRLFLKIDNFNMRVLITQGNGYTVLVDNPAIAWHNIDGDLMPYDITGPGMK